MFALLSRCVYVCVCVCLCECIDKTVFYIAQSIIKITRLKAEKKHQSTIAKQTKQQQEVAHEKVYINVVLVIVVVIPLVVAKTEY